MVWLIDNLVINTSTHIIKEADYIAQQKFTVYVIPFWGEMITNDYTLSIYSLQDLEINNEFGISNMTHFDG